MFRKSVLTLIGVVACSGSVAVENDIFAFGIAGIQSALWKDFEPLYKNLLNCATDKKLETSVCSRVSEEVGSKLYDALAHATLVNALNEKGPYFCYDYPKELIKAKKVHEGRIYSLLLIENRLKYGSGLYGDRLPETYVAKMILDELVDEYPCEKQ